MISIFLSICLLINNKDKMIQCQLKLITLVICLKQEL